MFLIYFSYKCPSCGENLPSRQSLCSHKAYNCFKLYTLNQQQHEHQQQAQQPQSINTNRQSSEFLTTSADSFGSQPGSSPSTNPVDSLDGSATNRQYITQQQTSPSLFPVSDIDNLDQISLTLKQEPASDTDQSVGTDTTNSAGNSIRDNDTLDNKINNNANSNNESNNNNNDSNNGSYNCNKRKNPSPSPESINICEEAEYLGVDMTMPKRPCPVYNTA